ncbi:excisionase [Serratia fonticola]|uniref:Excisionase n=1 Tax=Serratia fonticola TaxID=47917 RepID=A0AAJ1Y8G4_SERFO|nr:excisionase [Serratia fonticola]MDQ9124977.1 excisionase [Serratia fonticola]
MTKIKFITLKEWNSRLPRPRSEETVRRWVRAGKIYPAPILDGREYLFDDRAIKIDPKNLQKNSVNRLLERINDGKNPKPRPARPTTKSVRP